MTVTLGGLDVSTVDGTLSNTGSGSRIFVLSEGSTADASFGVSGSSLVSLVLGTSISGSTGEVYVKNGRTFTIHAPISGSKGISKTGAGVLVLSGANTYTGETIVSNGELRLAGHDRISTGLLTVNGGTFNLSTFNESVGTVTLSNGGSINGTGTLSSTSSFELLNGTANAILGGAVAVNKTTGDTVTLSGANSYTGATNISAGVLRISNGSALGTIAAGTTVGNGAALEIQGGITIGAELLSIAGSGISSAGVLRNTSGSNTYGGLLTLTAHSRINADAGSSLLLSNTGTITGSGFNLTVGGAGNVSINSNIGTNNGGLTKDGLGTLTLSGVNSYSGSTSVSGGVLRISNGSALGTTAAGTTVSGGAALEIQGGITIGSESLSIAGSGISSGGVLRNTSGSNTYGGLLTLTDHSRINSDAGSSLTLSNTGTITGSGFNLTVGGSGDVFIASAIGTGSGGLIKEGAGLLSLSGDNNYSGLTTISGGTLEFLAGTASMTGDVDNFGTLVFNQSADSSFSGDISGSGSLEKSGSARLTLSGENSYSGGTTVSGGVLEGDTDSLQGNIDIGSEGAEVFFNQGVNGTFAGDLTGNGSLRKAGVGTLTLTGNNNYTGGTFVDEGSLVGNVSNVGGEIDLSTNTELLLTQDGGVGTFFGQLYGEGTVIKTGNGSVEIDWIDDGEIPAFTGNFQVGDGALVIASSASINASIVTVSSTGSLEVNGELVVSNGVTIDGSLAGSGTIYGDVTVNGSLNPGNSPETITVEGDLTLASTQISNFELNRNDYLSVGMGVNDLVAVNGNLVLDGILRVTDAALPPQGIWTTGGTLAAPFSWTLFTFTGTLTNLGLELDLANMPTLTGSPAPQYWKLKIDYDPLAGPGGSVKLEAVPEPSSALLLGGVLMGAACMRRRRVA